VVKDQAGEVALLAGLGDVLARIVPEASGVVIVHYVLKLISQCIKDKDQWARLMWLVVPLLLVSVALIGVAAWWALDDGGLQAILHGAWPVQSRRK
jgi:hypothetical protein